jgi:hypothetical protein
VKSLAVAGLLITALSLPLAAQDPRLAARLDRETNVAVAAIIDSARKTRLPTAPLTDKALEGAAMGSDGTKIVLAVRQLSVRLAEARRMLGPASTADEIKAGAGALDAGVAARDLSRLRTAAGKRAVTLPLAVLTDLVGREVPVATATNLVLSLARSRVGDTDLSTFQRNVRVDIEHGADPSTAATTRARGLILRVGSTSGDKPTG